MATRGNRCGSPRKLNQGFCGGSLLPQPLCYQSIWVLILTDYLFLLLQSRTDTGHIPFPNRCTRHFPLLHHAPIISQIYPLSGQGRQVWQRVRKVPMKTVWWDVLLALQDLAEAIRIIMTWKHRKDTHKRIGQQLIFSIWTLLTTNQVTRSRIDWLPKDFACLAHTLNR